MRLYVIIDWQNEEEITIFQGKGFKSLEEATKVLIYESTQTGNVYLKIVEI